MATALPSIFWATILTDDEVKEREEERDVVVLWK